MSEKYYFLSSLPTLSFKIENPMSLQEFASACSNSVSFEDMELVFTATLDVDNTDSDIKIIKDWFEFELGLKNEITKSRANKLSKDPAEYYVEDYSGSTLTVRAGLQTAVKSAVDENPFNAEIALLQYRWDFLEELETVKYFTFDNLVIYYLKLQILNRKALLSSLEKGKVNFDGIYENIYKSFKEAIKL